MEARTPLNRQRTSITEDGSDTFHIKQITSLGTTAELCVIPKFRHEGVFCSLLDYG